MRHLIAFSLMLFSFVSVADGQRRSLREMVWERQADIDVAGGCGIFSLPVNEVAPRSTLLVHGVIESSQARLSSDQTSVVTEVTVRLHHTHQVSKDRNWSSPPQVIVLHTIGGIALVDGYRVSQPLTKIGWRIPPSEGLEVFLVAAPGGEPDQFVFHHYGAFVIDGERVSPMGTVSAWPNEVRLDGFVKRLQKLLGTRSAANRP